MTMTPFLMKEIAMMMMIMMPNERKKGVKEDNILKHLKERTTKEGNEKESLDLFLFFKPNSKTWTKTKGEISSTRHILATILLLGFHWMACLLFGIWVGAVIMIIMNQEIGVVVTVAAGKRKGSIMNVTMISAAELMKACTHRFNHWCSSSNFVMGHYTASNFIQTISSWCAVKRSQFLIQIQKCT